MKIVLFGAAAFAAAAALSTAASAQEWAGFYAGVNVGGLNQSGDNDERLVFDRNLDRRFDDSVTTAANADAFSPGFCGGAATGAANANCRADEEGVDYGVRAGVDWQTGAWVFGIVGELTSVDATDSVSGFSTTPASYTLTREANWMLGARFRAGYAAGPYLIYGTGGLAHADVDHRFDTSNTMNAFTPRDSDSLNGHQWGLGVERKWNDSWSLGLEYLFTTLDDDEYTVRVTQGTAMATNPFVLAPNTTGTDIRRSEKDFEFDSIRLSLNYRFR
jgi:opacity protein-like surface antigen